MTKNIELPVVSKSVGGLSRESLETLAAVEASLTAQDTTEADRLNYKNAVEEYIYDIRDKVWLPKCLNVISKSFFPLDIYRFLFSTEMCDLVQNSVRSVSKCKLNIFRFVANLKTF